MVIMILKGFFRAWIKEKALQKLDQELLVTLD